MRSDMQTPPPLVNVLKRIAKTIFRFLKIFLVWSNSNFKFPRFTDFYKPNSKTLTDNYGDSIQKRPDPGDGTTGGRQSSPWTGVCMSLSRINAGVFRSKQLRQLLFCPECSQMYTEIYSDLWTFWLKIKFTRKNFENLYNSFSAAIFFVSLQIAWNVWSVFPIYWNNSGAL